MVWQFALHMEVVSFLGVKIIFYFVEEPCEKRNPGYPLDSIRQVPQFNKYLVELTEEDRKNQKRKRLY